MRQISWKIWEGGIREDTVFRNRKQNRITSLAWNSCQFSNDFLIQSLPDGQILLLTEVCEFPVLNARLTQHSHLFRVQAVQSCWSCQRYTLYFCADITFLIVQILKWYGFIFLSWVLQTSFLLKPSLRGYHCDDISLFLKRWELVYNFHSKYDDWHIFAYSEAGRCWPLLQHTFFWNFTSSFMSDCWCHDMICRNFSNHWLIFSFGIKDSSIDHNNIYD